MHLTRAFKKFFDISTDGLFITDRENRFLEVNQSYCNLAGWSRAELLSMCFTDINPQKKVIGHFEDLSASGNAILTTSHKRKNGGPVEVEISTTQFKSGVKILFLNHVKNITKYNGAEALQEKENFRKIQMYARYLIDSSFDMIVAVDRDRKIVEFNKAAQNTFGYTKAEVLGKNITILYSDPEGAKIPADVLLEKGYFSSEVWNKRKNGELFQSFVTATVIKDPQGKVIGTMGVSRDITEQKNREEELKRAKLEAEAASRAKDDFFGNMTHEIRTPLNSIIGFTDFGLETNSSAEMKQYLSTIKESADFLLILLNSVLDYSKIEANKLELHKTEFLFRMAVENVTEIISAQAQQKDIELLCHISPDVPKYLIGDSPRLKQVLVNIIGNSVKFTEKGEIVVDIQLSPPSEKNQKMKEDEVELLFSIKDTGIGISPENILNIFESFVQVDSSTTRKFGGTGLGLTIANRLVGIMGGKVWVESKTGKGSTFFFTASFSRGLKPVPVEEKWDLSGKSALIIDRNEMSRFILREMLEEWGLNVHEAENGLNGIKELKTALSEGRPYDLTIFDSRLSDIPGFKIAQNIKKNPSLTKYSLIMLNLYHRSGDIDKVSKKGLAGYMLKPIKQINLQKFIAKSFGLKFCGPSEAFTERESKPSRKRTIETIHQSSTPLPTKTDLPPKLKNRLSFAEVLSSPESRDKHLLSRRKEFTITLATLVDKLGKVIGYKNASEIEKTALEIKKEALDVGATLIQQEAFRIVLASRNEDICRCKFYFERLVKGFKITKDIVFKMDTKQNVKQV